MSPTCLVSGAEQEKLQGSLGSIGSAQPLLDGRVCPSSSWLQGPDWAMAPCWVPGWPTQTCPLGCSQGRGGSGVGAAACLSFSLCCFGPFSYIPHFPAASKRSASSVAGAGSQSRSKDASSFRVGSGIRVRRRFPSPPLARPECGLEHGHPGGWNLAWG